MHEMPEERLQVELTKLIYASNHSGLDAGVLDSILAVSRANNERDGITGVLVACEEDFIQLLEGDRPAVADCMIRIMKDVRHQNIRIVSAGEAGSRMFAQWSMHNIHGSQAENDIMRRYMANGKFDPESMTLREIEQLCMDLSAAT